MLSEDGRSQLQEFVHGPLAGDVHRLNRQRSVHDCLLDTRRHSSPRFTAVTTLSAVAAHGVPRRRNAGPPARALRPHPCPSSRLTQLVYNRRPLHRTSIAPHNALFSSTSQYPAPFPLYQLPIPFFFNTMGSYSLHMHFPHTACIFQITQSQQPGHLLRVQRARRAPAARTSFHAHCTN